MKNWDKILKDFSHKCKGGAPDLKNSTHLQFLRESLIKFGWKENATNEFIGNLREGKPKTNPWQTKSGNWRGERPDGSRQSYDDIEKTKRWIGGDDFEDESDSTSGTEVPEGKKGKVQGDPEVGDNQVKNDVLELGFAGFEDTKGEKPAPGNAGSAFNEIVSGQGVEILDDDPTMSEEDLASRLYNQFGETALAEEQKLTTEIKDDEYPKKPPVIENLKRAKQDKNDYITKTLGEKPARKNYKTSEEFQKAKKDWTTKKKEIISDAVNKDGPETENGKAYLELLKKEAKAEQDKAKMSKCIVSARSAKSKSENSQKRTKKLQEKGKLGSPTKTHTFYGAEDSKRAQIDILTEVKKNKKKVLLPNGTEVNVDDAIAFVQAGGGGANPSDTATFVTDEEGNVMLQFHSDKTSTADIQDNSTLAKEDDNYRKKLGQMLKDGKITKPQYDQVIQTMNDYDSEIDTLDRQYGESVIPLSQELEKLDINDQVEIFQDLTELDSMSAGDRAKDPRNKIYGKAVKTVHSNLNKNFETNDKGQIKNRNVKKNYDEHAKKLGIVGEDGKPKNPNDLTLEEKYKIVRSIVKDGKGTKDQNKVIDKVSAHLNKTKDLPQLSNKSVISNTRKQVVDKQRERVEKLNEVIVDGKPLGTLMEAEETIRGFHLSLLDERDYTPPQDESGMSDEEKQKAQEERFKGIISQSFDVNMGGNVVDGQVLRECMGVSDTQDFKDDFELVEEESYTYQDAAQTIVTGKNVFRYVIDKKKKKDDPNYKPTEIGQKTYRSKDGPLAPTSNTLQWSTEMQDCFKGKK